MKEKLQMMNHFMNHLLGNLDQTSMIRQIKYKKQDIYGAEQPRYDDQDWDDPIQGITFNKDDGMLWIRAKIVVPEKIAGIPLTGNSIRIMSIIQAPMELYIDERLALKENSWVDFRCPEVIVAPDAVPGSVHLAAFRIDAEHADLYHNRFFIEAYADKVDDIRFDLQSFQAECQYAATLPQSEQTLSDMADWLIPQLKDCVDRNDASNLSDILAKARLLCEPIRQEAKKRKIHLVGHAHIDMNWLWKMEETKDLIKRDFTTVCNISDDYPAFRFSQSQCAAYHIAEKYCPDVFSRVKEKITSGKWDVTASAWVEHDANLISGESMARHLLYSQQYLSEKFNIKPQILWAPDTFGHSANIPQLLNKSGVHRYFMMRCGKENHDTPEEKWGYGRKVSDSSVFLWKGLDGSTVVSANLEYNGSFNPYAVVRNMLQAEDQGLPVALLVYGVGDHGGAPTRRDVQRIITADKSPLYPQIILSTTDDYYRAAEKYAPKNLHTYDGELNFIFEGCYTTHADIKQRNRQLESMLKRAETLAWMAGNQGYQYPFEQLRDAWLCLLFNQFHDIFDGCAIASTYELAISDMDAALKRVQEIVNQAAEALTASEEKMITILNPTPHKLQKMLFFPGKQGYTVSDEAGTAVASQASSDGLYVSASVPGLSAQAFCLQKQQHTEENTAFVITQRADGYYVDTKFYYLIVKKDSGQIVTYYDKQTKRFLARRGEESWRSDRGLLNTFSVTREAPVGMSAWTLGTTQSTEYLTHQAISEISVNGPLMGILSFRHRFNNSEIRQKIIFSSDHPNIDFQTEVDWKEVGNAQQGTPVLRAEFVPEIDNDRIYSEIPFGVLQRSVKKGEYPQLRFSAVQDAAGGFALLNDCKYGIHTCANQMNLTLIRSGWDPDLKADIGHHTFTYALYTFQGKIDQSDILAYAEQLQAAPLILEARKPAAKWTLMEQALPPQIAVSCIKAAEDKEGIIIRVYESFGDEVTMTWNVPTQITAVNEVETGENTVLSEEPILNGQLHLHFSPYEIKTLHLR